MTQALLVIDVQNDVVNGSYRRDDVVGAIRGLVDRARLAGVPVIWVQHNDPWLPIDSDDWQVVAELSPRSDEPRIDKQYRSAFEATDLTSALTDVEELIVCGAETNYCIRHTIHAALERGLSVTLVEDAHTCSSDSAEAVIAEQNANCAKYALPGRTCVTRPASAIFSA